MKTKTKTMRWNPDSLNYNSICVILKKLKVKKLLKFNKGTIFTRD